MIKIAEEFPDIFQITNLKEDFYLTGSFVISANDFGGISCHIMNTNIKLNCAKKYYLEDILMIKLWKNLKKF